MSFINFFEGEIVVKTPKPYKETISLNLKEYSTLISESILGSDKKQLLSNLSNKNATIPVYSEKDKRFFMFEMNNKKKQCREIKSREDKALCGVLLNSMLIKEEKEGKNELSSLKLNWDAPQYVFKTKR